jgi:hypothetical protein
VWGESRPSNTGKLQFADDAGLAPVLTSRREFRSQTQCSSNKKRTELASPFVPVLRLTSPLRVMPAVEPSLGRNQLGAIATLGAVSTGVKGVGNGLLANCALFFLRSRSLRWSLCALERSDQHFAEPGMLSSTTPVDRPLPRSASR